jgi:hypothetical protein
MPSGPKGQGPETVRCELCGRGANHPKLYTIFVRAVPIAEKDLSLTTLDTAAITQEKGFRPEDYRVCERCERRRFIFLAAALALLAGWIWMAVESDGPLFPLIGFIVILAFSAMSSRSLPVQRLVRRIKRERLAALRKEDPENRFRIETLTESAYRMRQGTFLPDRIVKRCGACKAEVPASSKVGDNCPHCGVRWGWEDKQPGAAK